MAFYSFHTKIKTSCPFVAILQHLHRQKEMGIVLDNRSYSKCKNNKNHSAARLYECLLLLKQTQFYNCHKSRRHTSTIFVSSYSSVCLPTRIIIV